MPDRIVITGLGVVSAAGVTREAFFDSLSSGASGIRVHPAAPAAAEAPPFSAGLRATPMALIGDFGAKRILDPRTLRRIPRLAQLVLVAAREAVAQAAPGEFHARDRTGVVLGTGLGTTRETIDFVRGYIQGGPESASPTLFPSSVMNAAAGQLAIELGLRGANTTVNHRETSSTDALAVACDFLALRRADALLVGAVDEASDIAQLGYSFLARLSPTALRPYARERDGTVLGEGAAVMYVEREADALRRGARILAVIAGRAAGGEARSRVGWSSVSRPLAERAENAPAANLAEGAPTAPAAAVIRAALDDADLTPADIGYIAGSGTGLALDGLEARALAAVFSVAAAAGRPSGRPVPIGSILGQTGDFMSSAILRVASAIYAFERSALPGTTGHGSSDPDVPVPGLVREPRPAEVRAVLIPTLAQGGANAALVLLRS